MKFKFIRILGLDREVKLVANKLKTEASVLWDQIQSNVANREANSVSLEEYESTVDREVLSFEF